MMGYFDEDWTKVKYFTKKEFLCKCGKCERDTGVSFTLVRIIDMMREDMKFPLRITSGYRCPKHEFYRDGKSSHARGYAVDIYCDSSGHRFKMVEYALKRGIFTRIGIASNFLHFDIDDSEDKSERVMWTY